MGSHKVGHNWGDLAAAAVAAVVTLWELPTDKYHCNCNESSEEEGGGKKVRRAVLIWAFGEGFPEIMAFKLKSEGFSKGSIKEGVFQTEVRGSSKLLRQDGACPLVSAKN